MYGPYHARYIIFIRDSTKSFPFTQYCYKETSTTCKRWHKKWGTRKKISSAIPADTLKTSECRGWKMACINATIWRCLRRNVYPLLKILPLPPGNETLLKRQFIMVCCVEPYTVRDQPNWQQTCSFQQGHVTCGCKLRVAAVFVFNGIHSQQPYLIEKCVWKWLECGNEWLLTSATEISTFLMV